MGTVVPRSEGPLDLGCVLVVPRTEEVDETCATVLLVRARELEYLGMESTVNEGEKDEIGAASCYCCLRY